MKKILLSTIAASLMVVGLNAKTVTVGDSKAVSAQAMTTTSQLSYKAGVDMNMTTAINYISGDKIIYTISSGTFNNATYYLSSTDQPDANMTSVNKTATAITFRAPSGGITSGMQFTLHTTEHNVTSISDLNITGASLSTAGSTLDLTVTSQDSTGSALDATTNTPSALATSYNQFTQGQVATVAANVIDVNDDRLEFVTGDSITTSERIVITFDNNNTTLDSAITLADADKLNIVITASSVEGIQTATTDGDEVGVVDTDAKTITFAIDGDLIATGNTETVNIDLNVTGVTTALSTRTFTAAAELVLDTEALTVGLITAGTTAGSWTVNGATVEMINMANNGLGTVTTATRLVNNDTVNAAELYVTVTNRTDATVYDEFQLSDTVPANGSFVLTASAIIDAAVAAGNDIEAGDDFSVSIMMTVPNSNAEAIVLQRSGTGQRVLGNSASNLSFGGL